jgi:malonyl-CoA/methylmalonyl-CoA synthetase
MRLLMPASFLDLLQVADRANRPALIHRGRTYSYGDLDLLARAYAARLHAHGVRKGDRVALFTAEKFPFLVAHLATLHAGGVSLPLNPRFTREEMRYFLADSGARVVVAGEKGHSLVEELAAELPELGAVLPDAAVCQAPRGEQSDSRLGPEDPCLIVYSSGTTGWPKGVVHTHAGLATGLTALRDAWRISPDDCIVNALPLFHVHGLYFATLLGLLVGASVRIEDRFDPIQTLKAIRDGTVFMAVPTMYYRFLELPEFRAAARQWPRARLFTCGSAPIRPEVLPELESVLGRPVINRYGMTEAHVITSLPLDGPWPRGSVGLPLAGVEVSLVDEHGAPVAAHQVGTVRLRGPNLFREYWRQPEATRAAFASGWFDTGDLGTRDEAGFLTLVGRKNDLIITSGYNVYPQVVERVLNGCPGVQESAVLGLPDERRGERVVAVVVRSDPTLDEKRVMAYCAEQLVEYQRPRALVFVGSLPRNTMGKVLRRELRAYFPRSA